MSFIFSLLRIVYRMLLCLQKYTLRADEMFLNRMIGGTFEGSNDPDFREKRSLVLDKTRNRKRLQTVVQIVFFKNRIAMSDI